MKRLLPNLGAALLLVATANAAHLRVEPALQTLPPGGLVQVDVWVDCPDVPVGAIALELPLGSPGLLSLAGVLGVQSSASGGFVLDHHVEPSTGNLRLLATSPRDPSRWQGSFRLCGLQFWIDPAAPPQAEAALTPTQVVFVASVATPDDGGLAGRPLPATSAGARILLDTTARVDLALHPADASWLPGRIHPVSLRLPPGPHPLGLLRGRVVADPARLRLLAAEPLRRDMAFLGNDAARASGSLPFVFFHRGAGTLPGGPIDLATIWVEPLVGGAHELQVVDLTQIDGDGMALLGVPLADVRLAQACAAATGPDATWQWPPPEGVISGQVMRVTLRHPVQAEGEGAALAAGMEWNPALWEFLCIEASPGSSRASVLTHEANLAAGRVRFLVSHAFLPVGTGDPPPALAEVSFRPRGSWLSTGVITGRVDAAALGTGLGAGLQAGTAPQVEPMHLVVFGPPGDANANALPDWWEAQFSVQDPQDDPDGDGHSNLQEWIALTDPVRRASRFGLASATPVPPSAAIPPGAQLLRWASARGRTYRILSTPDLRQPFTVLVDNLSATPPQNEYAVPVGARAFLTIQLLP